MGFSQTFLTLFACENDLPNNIVRSDAQDKIALVI